jgi:hypothetical protein
VNLDGGNTRIITKGLGSAGTADPLDQIATAGYKINGFASKTLDANRMIVMQAYGA